MRARAWQCPVEDPEEDGKTETDPTVRREFVFEVHLMRRQERALLRGFHDLKYHRAKVGN